MIVVARSAGGTKLKSGGPLNGPVSRPPLQVALCGSTAVPAGDRTSWPTRRPDPRRLL